MMVKTLQIHGVGVMQDQFYAEVTALVEHVDTLLTGGNLPEKPSRFLSMILRNTDWLLDLSESFFKVTPAEVSQQLRHDMLNPLTPMVGYADLLNNRLLDSMNHTQREHVHAIYLHISHLREIVNTLVDEARRAAGVLQ
jgi:signal transduction histidine kinase